MLLLGRRNITRGVSPGSPLPFTLKSILRQIQKNYGKLKYFTMQKNKLSLKK
jgi:hypothetical protein